MEPDKPDSFNDVWGPDPPEKKQARLENWKAEIGLQLGHPEVEAFAQELYQRLRAAPPEARIVVLRSVLGTAYAQYFGQSAK